MDRLSEIADLRLYDADRPPRSMRLSPQDQRALNAHFAHGQKQQTPGKQRAMNTRPGLRDSPPHYQSSAAGNNKSVGQASRRSKKAAPTPSHRTIDGEAAVIAANDKLVAVTGDCARILKDWQAVDPMFKDRAWEAEADASVDKMISAMADCTKTADMNGQPRIHERANREHAIDINSAADLRAQILANAAIIRPGTVHNFQIRFSDNLYLSPSEAFEIAVSAVNNGQIPGYEAFLYSKNPEGGWDMSQIIQCTDVRLTPIGALKALFRSVATLVSEEMNPVK